MVGSTAHRAIDSNKEVGLVTIPYPTNQMSAFQKVLFRDIMIPRVSYLILRTHTEWIARYHNNKPSKRCMHGPSSLKLVLFVCPLKRLNPP